MKGKEREETEGGEKEERERGREGGEGGERRVGGMYVIQKVLKKTSPVLQSTDSITLCQNVLSHSEGWFNFMYTFYMSRIWTCLRNLTPSKEARD